jgi:hypothetical protein
MDDETISALPAIPTPDKLAGLGMRELPMQVSGSR